MRRLIAFATAACVLSACSDRESPAGPAGDPQPATTESASISTVAATSEVVEGPLFDGSTGGNHHFFILPPLAPEPSATGTFDPSLTSRVVVEVCEWTANGCGALVAKFTAEGRGSERLRIEEDEGPHYHVNWHTRRSRLESGTTYRIRVLIPELIELGFVDVVPQADAGQSPGDPGEPVPIHNGRTLPIKFRIEEGALPTALIRVAGDAQEGAVNEVLTEPLVVQAVNDAGVGISGVFLGGEIAAGGGDLRPTQTQTDPGGAGTFSWVLGGVALNRARISVEGLGPVAFTAVALSSTPSSTNPTIWYSATLPVLLNIPTGDGEVIQVLGERDPDGGVAQVDGFVVFDPIAPEESDLLLLDERGLPVVAHTRDGTTTLFRYPTEDSVQLAVASPDGSRSTLMLSLDKPLPVAAVAPQLRVAGAPTFAMISSSPSPADFRVEVRTSVTAAGEPVQRAFVQTMLTDGGNPLFGTAWNRDGQQDGLYVVDWPLSSVIPIDLVGFCQTHEDASSTPCAILALIGGALTVCSVGVPLCRPVAKLFGKLTNAACASAHACTVYNAAKPKISPAFTVKSRVNLVFGPDEGIRCPRDWVKTDASFANLPVLAELSITCTKSQEVTEVRIEPDTLVLLESLAGRLTARAFDASGNEVPGVLFTWNAPRPAAARIMESEPSASVTIQAASCVSTHCLPETTPRTITVSATFEGVSGSAVVEVQPITGRWTGVRSATLSDGRTDTEVLNCNLGGPPNEFSFTCGYGDSEPNQNDFNGRYRATLGSSRDRIFGLCSGSASLRSDGTITSSLLGCEHRPLDPPGTKLSFELVRAPE